MLSFLIFSFLLYCPAMQASIISVDYVKNTMPELKAKKFVLFGDDHIDRPIDKQQLAALTQVLLKKDRDGDQKIYILVEQPAGTPLCASVINSICFPFNEYSHIIIENIEMRCATGAACYMLNPAKNPHGISLNTVYNSAYSTRGVSDIIMRDVDAEIDSFKRQFDTWAQTLSPKYYAQAIHIHAQEYDKYLQDYKRGCALCNLTPETNVLDASKLLYETNPINRKYLYEALDELSAMLFDMHILKSVLSLKTPAIIALIAGTYHTTQLLGGLERMGNKVIARYGKTWGPDKKPLPTEHLDIDPGCCSCCWLCPIQ